MNNIALFAIVVIIAWVAICFAILRGLDKEQYIGCDCTDMIQRNDK